MDETRAQAQIHVLKVTLAHVRPTAWRRLEVPSMMTLDVLSDVLRYAFDWSDEHLHEFEARGIHYGQILNDGPFLPWGRRVLDEDKATLMQLAPHRQDVADYTYDFGDDWQHQILVEEVRPADPDQTYPVCTGGVGQAPEEDTGEVRPGQFDDAARQHLNAQLRAVPGGGRGRELSIDSPIGPQDTAFSGLFPELIDTDSESCSCGTCLPGETADGALLPAANLTLSPEQTSELADLAADSPLVRQAVALATWVGAVRSVTPSGVLRPADAATVVTELGLDKRLLPSPNDGGTDRRAAARLRSVVRSIPRSAKDLPNLHALWASALAAGLIEIRGGKARPGVGLAVWQQASTSQARLDGWALLLAGYLRARDEAYRTDRGHADLDSVLATSVPLLYAAARHPVPVSAFAIGLIDLDELDEAILDLPDVLTAVSEVVEGWLAAGVLTVRVQELAETLAGKGDLARTAPMTELAQLVDEMRSAVAEAPPQYHDMINAIQDLVDSLEHGPVLQLTSLGSYSLARLLTAHGWQLPIVGACAEVAPSELLDRLTAYLPEDAEVEVASWLEARGAERDAALREVIATAATKAPEGPLRRAVMRTMMTAAGPSTAPVLASWQGDPWLGASVALLRHEFGAGPVPSLAQLLWIAVDGLSVALEDDDEEAFADALDSVGLIELLTRPGAITAAVGLSHPRALEVLHRVLPAIEDPQFRRELQKKLAGGKRGPAKGRSPRRGHRSR